MPANIGCWKRKLFGRWEQGELNFELTDSIETSGVDTHRAVCLAECVVLRPPPYQDGSQEMMCFCLHCTGYGLEVDMWAAGVILYILLCGFPPFRSPERDQEELFNIIQLGRFEFLAPYWDNISDGETLGFPGRRWFGGGELGPFWDLTAEPVFRSDV